MHIISADGGPHSRARQIAFSTLLAMGHTFIGVFTIRIDPCSVHDFSRWMAGTPSVQYGDAVFKLLKNSEELARAGRDLKNCAATYVEAVLQGKSIVVLMSVEGKPKALGEWRHKYWEQIVESCNETARDGSRPWIRFRKKWID